MNFKQFIGYCIIAVLFMISFIMDALEEIYDFLNEAQNGGEEYLMDLGWEVTKED